MTLLIMPMPYPKLLFLLFLLHPLFSSGTQIKDRVAGEVAVSEGLQLEWQKEQISPSSRGRVLVLDDDINPPNTIFPTTPISTTPFVTVPATNPVTVTPTTNPANTPLPLANPVMPPPAPAALTNPVMAPPAPATLTNPVMAPPAPATLTNPVMAPPAPAAVTNPVMAPPAATNAPAGQSWCVVKSGAPESSVQAALDYACGIGGADCAQIQQSGSCYNPITLQSHASFAFNSYYQKHPSPSSCDFGGTATITSTNPSSGSCIFPSSSSSAAAAASPSLKSPPNPSIPPPSTPSIPPPSTTSIPPPSATSIPPPTFSTPPPQISTPTPVITPTPTPSTSSSSGAGVSGSGGTPPMPMILNSSDPTSGTPTVFGSEVPPSVNTTTTSISPTLQPFLVCIFLVTCFATQIITQ